MACSSLLTILLLLHLLAISNTFAADVDASVYDCAANVSIHRTEITQFSVNYLDPHPVRFLRALRFSEQHKLSRGYGCETSACVAHSLLASIDGTLCAQLLRWQSVFVSIGEMCDVAMSLRYAKARSAAFPFDWNVSPLGKIADMLENNFTGGFLGAETTHFGVSSFYDFIMNDDFDDDDSHGHVHAFCLADLWRRTRSR